MPEYPDIYADGLGIAAGPYGMTLTFQLTQPSGVLGVEEATTIPVARIRVSLALASFMVEALRQAVANVPQAGPPQSGQTALS